MIWGQSGPGSDGNQGVLNPAQHQKYRTLIED